MPFGYGPFLSIFGSGAGAVCDYPAVGDVQDGVSFDGGGQVGTLEIPVESDVRLGVDYGADGTEFEGTLIVPTLPGPGDASNSALEAFRDLLINRLDVAALVGSRIYGGNMPVPIGTTGIGEAERVATLLPCIVLTRVGGTPNDRQPIINARIDVRCIAETIVAAQDVFETVNRINNLENYDHGDWTFYSISGELSEIDNREQITDSSFFPTVYSTWDVRVGIE